MDLDLWEDNKSPVVQIRPSEVSLDYRESAGFLTDRLIGVGSSFLRRSPENGLYILSKCILKNRVLSEILYLYLFVILILFTFTTPVSESINSILTICPQNITVD